MKTIKKHLIYTIKKYLIRFLVNLRIKRVSKPFDKFIETWDLDESYRLDKKIISLHKKKWGTIFKRKIDPKELICYSRNTGIISPDYVPLCVYQTVIEPILNDTVFSESFGNKNLYDLLYAVGIFPDTILRNIDGNFFDNAFEPVYINSDNDLFNIVKGTNSIIIKPSIKTGGGKNIQKYFLKEGSFVNKDGDPLTIKMLDTKYQQNYLIQKVLNQHSFFSQFNKTSLNTIKVFTYFGFATNRPTVLHAVLRIGAEGQPLDNTSSGGYGVGVNKNGGLNNYAVLNDGKRIQIVNGIKLTDNQFTIPYFEDIRQTAIGIAKRNIHHRILALDMTVDDLNKIRCVEVNTEWNGIDIFQLNNGPLFGEYTEEVIEHCKNNISKLYSRYCF